MTRHQPYLPPLPQTTAALIRVDTCDTRRCTPSCVTARGHRVVVPPGHGGRGVPLTCRALAPAGAGIRSGTLTVSSYILHSTFYILHWTYTFSAKERDSETGLSYFGSRYYSSDLSVWLSVDPMAAKYPSLSPYTYCANNPVRVVDPNGDTLLPSAAFQASPYYMVYQNLNQTNSVYKRSVNQYQGANNNLYFDYKTEATEKAGHTDWFHRAKGTDITVTAKTTYYRPFGEDQTEIAMAKTLLHEAVHAENGLSKRRTPFHDGFDQASVLAGLIEYNSTSNLGYSNEDLEILS